MWNKGSSNQLEIIIIIKIYWIETRSSKNPESIHVGFFWFRQISSDVYENEKYNKSVVNNTFLNVGKWFHVF